MDTRIGGYKDRYGYMHRWIQGYLDTRIDGYKDW